MSNEYREKVIDTVARRLEHYQKEMKLSGLAMSQFLGVKHTTYRSWLNKNADIRASNVALVCDKLGITPNELLTNNA